MDFKVDGPWNIEKYCLIGRQEKLLTSWRSRMAKTATFWPWWQSFNSFYLKTLSFFLCFPFFFLLRKTVAAGGHGPLSLPGVAGPGKVDVSLKCGVQIVFSSKWNFPVDTGRKLNVHKTFRRRPGRLLNILCTFNLRTVSTGLFLKLFSTRE